MTAHNPYDVVVIGAGLAGSCLAGTLARTGVRTLLLDAHAVHPRDFRAEKYGAAQMAQFEGLGFGPVMRACTTRTDGVQVVRYGWLSHREPAREYDAPYPVLVNALRASLPPDLLTVARVADLDLGPDRQAVTLSDGRRIEARLAVLATGLGEALRRKAGIGRAVVGARHSLSIGFDMAAPASAFPWPALTYYPEAFGGRDAYLTLFPFGQTMRANLFCYREPNEAWTRAFRADPEAGLRALMPRLARHCPDLRVAGPVEVRPIDLCTSTGHVRDGVVLLGDAFQTACPVPGTGVGKVLTDVERLLAHLPDWLATPGMGADKIAGFYADPVKTAFDARSLEASLYARAVATEPGLRWSARRTRNQVGRTAIRAGHAARAAAATFAGMLVG